MTKPKHRVALVIGSGGLKCAAVIGVMQVLEQQNIKVDMVVGCSGGAVFGAAIALGYDATGIDNARAQAWTDTITSKPNLASLAQIAVPGIFGFSDEIGIFDDRIMTDNIEQAFGAQTTFANTEIPFYVVATNFNTGEPVVITDGPLAKAVRASAGIPILFKPLELNGQLLVDGGVSNPLPIDVAIQNGADVIIALGFETPMPPSVTNPAGFASQMFTILVNQLLYKKFAFYNLAYHSEIIAIVPEFKESIKISDVHSVPYIIEQGRQEAMKHLPHLQKILARKATAKGK